MFRFLFCFGCLVIPVICFSTGAPPDVCGDLTPQHGLEGQRSLPPHSLTGADTVKSGDAIQITLQGKTFKGFAVQARDQNGKPAGKIDIIDNQTSQVLQCGGPNTITHKKTVNGIDSVKFSYTAPNGYKGAVKFVATVAENGAVFWVQKLVKEVQIV